MLLNKRHFRKPLSNRDTSDPPPTALKIRQLPFVAVTLKPAVFNQFRPKIVFCGIVEEKLLKQRLVVLEFFYQKTVKVFYIQFKIQHSLISQSIHKASCLPLSYVLKLENLRKVNRIKLSYDVQLTLLPSATKLLANNSMLWRMSIRHQFHFFQNLIDKIS